MDESFTLFSFMILLFLSLMFPIPSIFALNSTHLPPCHDYERLALFQFKESFVIDKDASSNDPLAYPKVKSWKLNGDCCSWDGVDCDHLTGHVTGLDLSSSCLYGSINSNSSLFRLVHLRKLNLAYNHFNYSQIPPTIGILSKLVSLDMSNSFLSGPIPSNVSELSSLSSLELHLNYQLSFQASDFRHLINNLTRRLEVLSLSEVNISSTVPAILANASSLSGLGLRSCGLYGEFPVEIFHLPKLEFLNLNLNENLRGYLPEFHSTSPLKVLWLASTNFSGEIPGSIGNLDSLADLDLSYCTFSGQIPGSLGNLTKLIYLYLRVNAFDGQHISSLSSIARLTKLVVLDFSKANLHGEFPSWWFANLTQLCYLNLGLNQLTGPIPTSLVNLTDLITLDLSSNSLQGSISKSISQLRNLVFLGLGSNRFSGTVEWDIFLQLENLQKIVLSDNNLTLLINPSSNKTFQEFRAIEIADCKLDVFPDFLRYQDKLKRLDLSRNNIAGQIPKWLFNMSTDSLQDIDLSSNFLTGFEAQPNPMVLPWIKAADIDLSHNMLQSSPPLPPASVENYRVSGNELTGEIPPLFCNLTTLYALRMDNNQLSGTLPSCLGNSTHLEVLSLGRNNFYGTIPLTFSNGSSLRMIQLSYNQLHGELPRSLSNCTKLEFLDAGDNQISDFFPSWLGPLPNLKVLILSSNQFHGVLNVSATLPQFQKLRIIDLSKNNFTGQFPTQYFFNWEAMKVIDEYQLTYMKVSKEMDRVQFEYSVDVLYSMLITSKGTERGYDRILENFIVVDLSCNRFEGDIPEVIGSLQGLRLLNLSHNNLKGHIPSTFANLTSLESLDLSQNKLSGTIPQQLAQLNSLAVFNVSHNLLAGPIPQGKQFNTFQNDSYLENLGLCGNPLSRKCGNSEAPPRSPSSLYDEDNSSSLLEFGWESVVIGYASGLVFGLAIGYIAVTKHFAWFARFFRVRVKRTRRARNRRARN